MALFIALMKCLGCAYEKRKNFVNVDKIVILQTTEVLDNIYCNFSLEKNLENAMYLVWKPN